MDRRQLLSGSLAALLGAALGPARAAGPVPVRVATLGFGTGNWEVDVVKRHGFDRASGITLDMLELSGKDGPLVALQAGAVDAVLGDWLWVSRQRSAGRDYSFAPHSVALGSLMVRPDANIAKLDDLAGKKLGIAGGPVDKSWLLLRVYCQRKLGRDLADMVEPVYAAPPLLNHLVASGELPAVLDFWPYAARLKAGGMRQLIAMREVVLGLGVETVPPMLGWVFSDAWATANPAAIRGLLAASRSAKRLMAEDDAEWRLLQPLMEAPDEATFTALRDEYRAGIPAGDDRTAQADAEALFAVLAQAGGVELTGGVPRLAPGTFWNGAKAPA